MKAIAREGPWGGRDPGAQSWNSVLVEARAETEEQLANFPDRRRGKKRKKGGESAKKKKSRTHLLHLPLPLKARPRA